MSEGAIREIRFLNSTYRLVPTCADQESHELLKASVETLEPWEGVALRVIENARTLCLCGIPDDIRGKRTSSERPRTG
ncbi:hypothetical protein JTB14_034208 [Gonioctena quinquepunctata]|nr:hypothetical protein JTB14_034208 [Gonioctena quinquepunctata]